MSLSVALALVSLDSLLFLCIGRLYALYGFAWTMYKGLNKYKFTQKQQKTILKPTDATMMRSMHIFFGKNYFVEGSKYEMKPFS